MSQLTQPLKQRIRVALRIRESPIDVINEDVSFRTRTIIAVIVLEETLLSPPIHLVTFVNDVVVMVHHDIFVDIYSLRRERKTTCVIPEELVGHGKEITVLEQIRREIRKRGGICCIDDDGKRVLVHDTSSVHLHDGQEEVSLRHGRGLNIHEAST